MNVPVPRFNPEINLGHVLTTVSFIGFGLGAFFLMKGDIAVLAARTGNMEQSILAMTVSVAKIADTQVINARQDERLLSLDRRVENNERRVDRMERRTIDMPRTP